MKKISVAVTTVLFALALANQAEAQWLYEQAIIPHFAVGGGYQTTLLITNLSGNVGGGGYDNMPWTAYIDIYPSAYINNGDPTEIYTIRINGQPLPWASSSRSNFLVSLKLHETKRYVITTTRDYMINGSLRFDCATFSPMSSVFVSCFYNFYADGKLLSTIAVPVLLPESARYVYQFAVEKTNRVNYGVAWMIWGFPHTTLAPPDELYINLYSADGNLVGSRTFVNFPPYTAMFIDQLFPDIPPDFMGFISLSCAGARGSTNPLLAPLVLRMETNADGSFLFTSVPLFR
jgi:hypothetical protein